MIKKFFKILIYFVIVLVILFLLSLVMIFTFKGINAKKMKISSSNGINEEYYLKIGGIEQYIQIRGENKNNPVILFLHGGPGNPISNLSYYYQPYLISDYTVVDWDQRGCGNTYLKNPSLDVDTELSTEILLGDLDELVDYLMAKFEQDKVIIIGHSWGSLLGSKYVLDNPQKVSSYIGVGQVISLKEGYIHSAHAAIKKASEKDDNEFVSKLTSLTEAFSKTDDLINFDFHAFTEMQQYTMKYNRYNSELSMPQMIWTMLTSPRFGILDIQWQMKSNNIDDILRLQAPLLDDCFFNLNLYDFGTSYQVPMHYITGEFDINTPVDLLKPYFELLEAPQKTLTIMENTGHLLFMEKPENFAQVVRMILAENK